MVLNFLKIEEDLNYNIHDIEFRKTKTVFSTTTLKKEEYKITCPPAGRGVEFAGCRPAEW